MKRITEFLSIKGFLFSELKTIQPKELNSRKKIFIFSGCDLDNRFISIFVVEQKSRFVLKDSEELQLLQERLKLVEGHNFRMNLLLINGAICSKSITLLTENNWTIYNDFM